MAASLYLLTACALPVLNVVESWLATLVAWRSTNRLRIDLFRHCLAQDLDMIERHPPGALRWGPPPQRLVEARPEPRWRPAAGSPGALVICFH